MEKVLLREPERVEIIRDELQKIRGFMEYLPYRVQYLKDRVLIYEMYKDGSGEDDKAINQLFELSKWLEQYIE